MSNNLRALRTAAGLSQTALATKAGISPGIVSAVERYGYPASVAMRQRLAKALKVRVDEIWPPQTAAVA